jgi:hypothetical protein
MSLVAATFGAIASRRIRLPKHAQSAPIAAVD